MNLIETALYHGSTVSDISQLKINWSINHPLGPAIYLTTDPNVADCYYRPGGAIYKISVRGNERLTINLDASFRSQYTEAKMIIIKTMHDLGLPVALNATAPSKDYIHQNYLTRPQINRALAKNGIWMIYGTLCSSIASGLQDRGVQYAVIDESTVKIERQTIFSEIIKRQQLKSFP